MSRSMANATRKLTHQRSFRTMGTAPDARPIAQGHTMPFFVGA